MLLSSLFTFFYRQFKFNNKKFDFALIKIANKNGQKTLLSVFVCFTMHFFNWNYRQIQIECVLQFIGSYPEEWIDDYDSYLFLTVNIQTAHDINRTYMNCLYILKMFCEHLYEILIHSKNISVNVFRSLALYGYVYKSCSFLTAIEYIYVSCPFLSANAYSHSVRRCRSFLENIHQTPWIVERQSPGTETSLTEISM